METFGHVVPYVPVLWPDFSFGPLRWLKGGRPSLRARWGRKEVSPHVTASFSIRRSRLCSRDDLLVVILVELKGVTFAGYCKAQTPSTSRSAVEPCRPFSKRLNLRTSRPTPRGPGMVHRTIAQVTAMKMSLLAEASVWSLSPDLLGKIQLLSVGTEIRKPISPLATLASPRTPAGYNDIGFAISRGIVALGSGLAWGTGSGGGVARPPEIGGTSLSCSGS